MSFPLMKPTKNITLVAGGNDCEVAHESDIVQLYSQLMDDAKVRAASVVVSSICPRLSKPELCEKINSINLNLQAVCATKGIGFVDNSASFYLKDGEINDGYFVNDGINLTRRATDKLAEQLSLDVKDKADGVNKTTKRQPRKQQIDGRSTEHETSQTTSRGPSKGTSAGR